MMQLDVPVRKIWQTLHGPLRQMTMKGLHNLKQNVGKEGGMCFRLIITLA